MAANWGLRGKSVVALLLACALALVPAVLLGWRAMDDIRTHFGLAYAKNFTLLHRQKILAPVSRELALSRRFAESVVTRDWLLKEDDPARRALFFREAEGYRGDFRDHAYFIIASGSHHYYFNDGRQPYSERPRYTLEAGDPEDAWYFNTLRNSAAYNINVNVDSKLNLTKVWFNLVIRDQGRPIGLAGSGLDLSGFLDDFIIAREPGVTPMIVGDDGAIQAHPDRRLIAYSSAAGGASERHRVFDLLDQPEQRDALREAMRLARAKAGSVHCLWAGLDGRQQLFAVAYIPQLRWYVLTAVDLHAAQVLDNRWLRQPALRRHAPRPRAAAAPRAGRGLRGDARRVPGRAPATRRHHHPVLPIRLGAPMETLDLLAMRESYTRQRILLCFNGPISRSLIEEIGHALRNYLHAEQAKPSEAMDVFAVYIEMTQNIRHYANLKGYGEHEAAATVAIARNEDGHYVVSAGNLVERDDGQSLVRSIQAIANLDKAALKAAYKEQLRRPRDSGCASGAGLGLLDIARKSSEPLAASLKEQPDGRAFFSLRAVI